MNPADSPQNSTRLLSPRRMVLELCGFAIGLSLLIWIIYKAVTEGNWQKVLDAEAGMFLLLIGSTVISTLLNGATFWLTGQPLRPLKFWDMQFLNMAGNLLNYAPVRLGAISRVMYHLRIDQLSLLQITAWFGMIAYILALSVGSCLMATLLRPQIDLLWVALLLGQMIFGGLLTRILVGHPLIVKHGRGIDLMLRKHQLLWGTMVLRLLDIGAFAGRLIAALMILDINLPGADVLILAIVAFTANLIPFGRIGFREFCLVIVASRLGAQGGGVEGDIPWEQLAVIESAGEAIIYIPGGAAALVWYRKRWKARPQTPLPNSEN